MKTEVLTKKIEIVKQVKLTSNQRFTLVSMSNRGGRSELSMDYHVRADLVALGLIEERDRHTPAEKKLIEAEIRKLWKEAAPLLKSKDAEALDRTVDKIRGKQRDLSAKAYWLTPAADEYLTKGRVTIVR